MNARLIYTCAAVVLSLSAADARSQIAQSELAGPDFFGSAMLARVQKSLSPTAVLGTKDSPRTAELPDGFGTVFEFSRNGKPMLAVLGAKPIDLGEKILLPSDLLVVTNYVAIYSREDAVLTPADFPVALQQPLSVLWPSGQIRALAGGFNVRVRPTGDFQTALWKFFNTRPSGGVVVAFEKNKVVNTTKVMVNGTILEPFRIRGFDLTNPELAVTRAVNKPPVVAVAGDFRIQNRVYQLKAEGSKMTAPDIFLLTTDKLEPQDVANLVSTFSGAIYSTTTGAPAYRFSLIPTFSINGLRSYSSGLPPIPAGAQGKVVIFAALPGADNIDWRVKGPGLTIRGALKIDALNQEVGYAEAFADKDSLKATFDVSSYFQIPGTNVRLNGARETLFASASRASLRIEGNFQLGCLGDRWAWTFNAAGVATPDLTDKPALAGIDPKALFSRIKQCGGSPSEQVGLALETGGWMLGLALDPLLSAATSVFGASNVAVASKLASYPLDLVGKSLGTVLKGNPLLTLADSVWGRGGPFIGAIAMGAGQQAEDVMRWANSKGIPVSDVGRMFGKRTFPRDKLLTAANTVFGSDATAAFANTVGYSTQEFFEWGKAAGKPLRDVANMAGKAFDSFGVLLASSKVFQASNEDVARVSKALGYATGTLWNYLSSNGVEEKSAAAIFKAGGYAANEVGQWIKSAGYAGEQAIKMLDAAGFKKSEIKGALTSAYSWSGDAFEKAWGGVCKTLTFGLTEC